MLTSTNTADEGLKVCRYDPVKLKLRWACLTVTKVILKHILLRVWFELCPLLAYVRLRAFPFFQRNVLHLMNNFLKFVAHNVGINTTSPSSCSAASFKCFFVVTASSSGRRRFHTQGINQRFKKLYAIFGIFPHGFSWMATYFHTLRCVYRKFKSIVTL